MERRKAWITGLVVVVLVVAVLVSAALILLPREAGLRDRASAEVMARFGVELRIASLSWQLLPVPSVLVRGASTGQAQPISVSRLSATLDLRRTLLDWKPSLASVEIDGAVLPTASLAAFRGKGRPGKDAATTLPVGHLRFRNVVWISRTGIPLPIEGEVDFDPGWRPRPAQVRRTRFDPAARLTLEREAGADRWSARVALGGGTANGQLELSAGQDGLLILGGTLAPRGIEVASAAASLNRRSPVGGKANGQTTVSARGRTAGELGRSLRLVTEFRIAPARILRVDVYQAARSLGLKREGQTPLDEVTGVMDMQNSGRGAVLRFRRINAEADGFSATGEGTVSNRRVDARGTLHLVDGLIDVPFAIDGPVRDPQVAIEGGGQPEERPASEPASRPAEQRRGQRPGQAPDQPADQGPAGVRDER